MYMVRGIHIVVPPFAHLGVRDTGYPIFVASTSASDTYFSLRIVWIIPIVIVNRYFEDFQNYFLVGYTHF
jgi:hypothetical protein